jgi:hypothetical protein
VAPTYGGLSRPAEPAALRGRQSGASHRTAGARRLGQARTGITGDSLSECGAAVPGTYTGPASRAYLYYTDEFKCWTQGLGVTISPRVKAEPTAF